MHVNDLLKIAVDAGASDLHLKVGSYPMIRVRGTLVPATEEKRLDHEDVVAMSASVMPMVFDMWIDGLENPVIEELGAGTEALHLDRGLRGELMTEPGWRARFRSQWTNKVKGRVYHRDLREARIVGAPDEALVGRTFADVVARYARWITVIRAQRPHLLPSYPLLFAQLPLVLALVLAAVAHEGPIAAGALYPITGWLLSPVIASAAMSLSSITVLASSLRLRRFTPTQH